MSEEVFGVVVAMDLVFLVVTVWKVLTGGPQSEG